MADIQNRADIEQIMTHFYSKALNDEVIGHFFTEVVQLNLEAHLPVIVDFWDGILFQSNQYKGNPMKKHTDMHAISALEKDHFERWLSLFGESVDALFVGDNARLIKERALSIATVMRVKCV